MSDSPRKLPPDCIRGEGFGNARWQAYLPAGFAFEDALHPQFWANHARNMKASPGERRGVGDIIELRDAEHTRIMELYIRGITNTEVFVGILSDRAIVPAVPVTDQTLDVRWNVGARGYDVIRKSDRTIIKGGAAFPLREQAVAWIEQHRAAMNSTPTPVAA